MSDRPRNTQRPALTQGQSDASGRSSVSSLGRRPEQRAPHPASSSTSHEPRRQRRARHSASRNSYRPLLPAGPEEAHRELGSAALQTGLQDNRPPALRAPVFDGAGVLQDGNAQADSTLLDGYVIVPRIPNPRQDGASLGGVPHLPGSNQWDPQPAPDPMGSADPLLGFQWIDLLEEALVEPPLQADHFTMFGLEGGQPLMNGFHTDGFQASNIEADGSQTSGVQTNDFRVSDLPLDVLRFGYHEWDIFWAELLAAPLLANALQTDGFQADGFEPNGVQANGLQATAWQVNDFSTNILPVVSAQPSDLQQTPPDPSSVPQVDASWAVAPRQAPVRGFVPVSGAYLHSRIRRDRERRSRAWIEGNGGVIVGLDPGDLEGTN